MKEFLVPSESMGFSKAPNALDPLKINKSFNIGSTSKYLPSKLLEVTLSKFPVRYSP